MTKAQGRADQALLKYCQNYMGFISPCCLCNDCFSCGAFLGFFGCCGGGWVFEVCGTQVLNHLRAYGCGTHTLLSPHTHIYARAPQRHRASPPGGQHRTQEARLVGVGVVFLLPHGHPPINYEQPTSSPSIIIKTTHTILHGQRPASACQCTRKRRRGRTLMCLTGVPFFLLPPRVVDLACDPHHSSSTFCMHHPLAQSTSKTHTPSARRIAHSLPSRLPNHSASADTHSVLFYTHTTTDSHPKHQDV